MAPVSVIHEVGEFALTDLPAMPEFSRLVQVDAIGADGAAMELRADAEECAALARRLDLQGMENLHVEVSLRRTAAGQVRLNVDFSANVVQSCVVTLEAVRARVADRFSLLCDGEQKHGKGDDAEGEVFVDPFGEDPVEPLTDGCIDLGELVAQHLSLSLDPYPRASEIECAAVTLGTEKDGVTVDGEERAREEEADAGPDRVNPFAVLKEWRSGGRGDGTA